MIRAVFMWNTLIFGGVASLFIALAWAATWQLRRMPRLPSLDALSRSTRPGSSCPATQVRCSVVIAARDEASRLEQTLRRLFSQTGIDTEFIVVDDRSTDGTGEILDALASEEPRLRLQRVESLPEGWLGKCHACHVGALLATGDWILFTDADCWLKPDVIHRAILVAELENADHITLAPGVVVSSRCTRAWHLMFLVSLAGWFSAANRDRPKSYVGIGAFNLLRSSVYRKCGGYEALRLTVLDDVKLGLLVRRCGARTRAFLGAEDVECHWGATIRNMIKVMEKNYFAALDYRLAVVVVLTLVGLLATSVLIAGAVRATGWGITAVLSPLSLVVPAAILARRLGWLWTDALLTPLMLPVFCYAMLNSTWMTLSRGGIRWRDTFYPLKLLRAHNVQ